MLDDFLKTLSRFAGPRTAVLVTGALTTAVIWGFAQWGFSPRYVPVAAGLSIDRIGEASQRLTDEGIDVRLERGGAMLTVPEPDVAKARVALAADGLTGTLSTMGLEIFDQPAWGMTDFTQRVNLRRGLEGDLERTIRGMRGIENAEVHLSLEENTFIGDESENGEASVMLRTTSGGTAAADVVEGIQSLVASAAPGIREAKVAVLDDRGRLLSNPEEMSGAGVTTVQLKVRRQTEEYLERKAEELVSQMVGYGNATVQVAADLNFDQIDRTTQAVDPDEQLLVSENRSEITPGADDQGAGQVQTDTRFEATRSVETVTRSGGRIERLTVAVVVADRQIEQPDGTFTPQGRTPQELAQVEALVSNAVGLSPNRGDEISVVGTAFEVPPVVALEDAGVDIAALVPALSRPLVAIVALGVALFLSLRILSTLKTLEPRTVGPRLSAPDNQPSVPPAPAEMNALPPAPPEAQPQGVQLSDPAMTARVMRSWMNDG